MTVTDAVGSIDLGDMHVLTLCEEDLSARYLAAVECNDQPHIPPPHAFEGGVALTLAADVVVFVQSPQRLHFIIKHQTMPEVHVTAHNDARLRYLAKLKWADIPQIRI